MSSVWGTLLIILWLPIPHLTEGKGPTLQIRSMVQSKISILKTENLYQLVEAPVVVL